MSALRVRLAYALISAGLTFAPVQVPAWRLDPTPPPAAVLTVGTPTRGLAPASR